MEMDAEEALASNSFEHHLTDQECDQAVEEAGEIIFELDTTPHVLDDATEEETCGDPSTDPPPNPAVNAGEEAEEDSDPNNLIDDELRDMTDIDPCQEEKTKEDLDRIRKIFQGSNLKRPVGMSFGMLATSHTGPIPVTVQHPDHRQVGLDSIVAHLNSDSPCKGCQVHMPVEKHQWLRSQHANLHQKMTELGPLMELALMNEICEDDLENRRIKALQTIREFCDTFSMVAAHHIDHQEKNDGCPVRFEWLMDAGSNGEHFPFLDGMFDCPLTDVKFFTLVSLHSQRPPVHCQSDSGGQTQ